jgi:hypothetical protein
MYTAEFTNNIEEDLVLTSEFNDNGTKEVLFSKFR